MPVNPDDPTIPANCADATLPDGVGVDPSCFTPTLLKGPIVNLYYSKTPFSASPTALLVSTKLEADGDEKLIGPIVAQVSRTPPTGNTVRVNGEDIETDTTSQYQITVQDMSQANHDLMRQTQSGKISGHWYGIDANSKWRGGQNGLTGGKATLKLRENLPTGETDLQTATGTLTGTGKFDDAIMESPIPVVYGGS